MTEDQLQAKCWQWAWNEYPMLRRILWAVPNGGARDIRVAAKLQATGVIPGPHDLHMIWNGTFYTFELKVGDNHMTTDTIITTPSGYEKKVFGQVEFGAAMYAQGGKWFEIRELSVFQFHIRFIMQGGKY